MGAIQSRGIFMGKMKKKGVFFTFIAVMIMAVFILIYTPQADVTLQKDTKALNVRINDINIYINNLENSYFETVLRATTYKTILSLIFYINSSAGTYPINFDAAFQEVMINGTINKIQIDSITNKKIMENSTLTNWSNNIIQAAKDTLNVNTTIIINYATANQSTPWEIYSYASINIFVKSNVAEWNRTTTITTSMPIEGFHDPYYLAKTGKKYTNQIKKSTVQFNQWNISQVREHLRNGTYMHWENSNAPNFLMRFSEALTSSACCGIESLVNPNEITPSDQIESYVDYLFWTHSFNDQCEKLYNITKPPTIDGLWDEFRYFKLDLNHTLSYNISSQDAVRTC